MHGNDYRDARLARPMTQAALALAAGVSERTIRDLEKGRSVSAETILAVRAVLGPPPPKDAGTAYAGSRAAMPLRATPFHLVLADFLILCSVLPCLANLAVVAASTSEYHPIDAAIAVGTALCAFAPAVMAALFRPGITDRIPSSHGMLQRYRGLFGMMLTQPTIMESSSSSLSLASWFPTSVWIILLTVPSAVIFVDGAASPTARGIRTFARGAADEIRMSASQARRGASAILTDVVVSVRNGVRRATADRSVDGRGG